MKIVKGILCRLLAMVVYVIAVIQLIVGCAMVVALMFSFLWLLYWIITGDGKAIAYLMKITEDCFEYITIKAKKLATKY